MNVPTDGQCEIVAVALQKGGVGKTTTTINLGASLAAMGFRVLLIDMDQQAHSTKGLGVDLGADDASMYEVLHPDRAMRVPLQRSSGRASSASTSHLAISRSRSWSGRGSVQAVSCG